MAIRTKETTVTFDHPFSLTALEGLIDSAELAAALEADRQT
jgi:hypothetical protein